MATVLVTGGAGYIGAQTCKALSAAGHSPIVFDNFSRGWRDAVRWGPVVEGDIRDAAAVAAAFAAHRPAAVIHFAGLAYVGESVSDPALYYDINVNGAVRVFAAAAEAGAPVVFSSTCATYGEPEVVPIDEATPQVPINPYGVTKLVAERALRDLAAAHGLRWTALRYFNAAAADPDGQIGARHNPETRLIPLAIEAALGGAPLTVFGDDHPTPDGTCLRDYIHVADLAAAHVSALDRLLGGGDSLAVNLGTGRGSSVLEIIDAVEAALGVRPVYAFGPRRPGDPPALVARVDAAAAALGWRARYDLGAILRDAAAWRTRHGARFFPDYGAKT